MKLIAAFTIAVVVSNAILLLLYVVTLVKMYMGTKFKLFILLIILLIISSITRVLNVTSSDEVNRHYLHDKNYMPWGTVNSFSYAISTGTFDTAHWLFSFEYFTIAKTMPLALRGIKLAAAT